MAQATSVWRKDVLAWALFDFAGTIYSMNIVSLYLKRYIVEDLRYDDRYFDIPFVVSMICAAILSPALGAISDHTARKKVYLLSFTLACCIAVGFMAAVPSGVIFALVLLFMVSSFFYVAGIPFYNALLYSVADGKQARFVSGIGIASGYVGSVLGMLLVLPFVTGSLFGISVPFAHAGGKAASFVPTAILVLVFSIPLLIWVRERQFHQPERETVLSAYKDVWSGLKDTKRYPGVLRFLISDYFFEDAIATVKLNIGLYCSFVLGLAESQITIFLVISTLTAVAGSFVIGKIAERWSLKNLLTIIMWGWVASLVVFAAVDSMDIVWVLGPIVGVLLGGLWTTTRPMLAELVPHDQLGRFFGIFSLSGRAAAIIGPLIWTTVVYLFQPQRPLGHWASGLFGLSETSAIKLPYKLAVLSLAVLVLTGLLVFRKVPHTQRLAHD
ncbi:MAG TPA: MFS transporter [Candidatus Acidoferrum sp.]|nr:MFS transporter [Candidatus Acidoferrum sp.]